MNTYDYHNRLTESKATAVSPGTVSYDSTFGYDFFGNMHCTSSPGIGCPALSFDSNNHVTGANITYDAAGNMTQDGTGVGTHTYTYDGENRLTQVDSGATQTFLYNALGQRVEWTAGSTTYDELFDVDGNRIAQAVGGVWNTGNFFLGSRMLGAYIPGTGTVQFFHANALGSSSVITDGTGSVVNEQLFYPWGDVWEPTAGTPTHFAGFDWGYTQAGLDPTLFRMYSYGKGRWMTPDPAGLAVADITNPESWNRYAYVLNRPTSLTDRSGLLDDPACDNLDPDMDGDSFGSDPEEGFEGGQMCIQIAPIIPPLPIPPVPKSPPKPSNVMGKVKNALCSAIPKGLMVGVGGSANFISGPSGTAEAVLNFDTGQLSAFVSGGVQAGINPGGPQSSVFGGLIFGNLKGDNSGYQGGFTNLSLSSGEGGQVTLSASSGGLQAGPSGLQPNGDVVALSGGPSVSMNPLPGATVSATNFAGPLQLGTLPPEGFLAFYLLNQLADSVCK
ncbi:MAG TPA: RHS repeat-associated core domain-containing protein [Terriglobia bacterium]|nr:RHS repeat-associated core domain-containing protein [Terriglobia bacterium]